MSDSSKNATSRAAADGSLQPPLFEKWRFVLDHGGQPLGGVLTAQQCVVVCDGAVGDVAATIYCLNAVDGSLLWKRQRELAGRSVVRAVVGDTVVVQGVAGRVSQCAQALAIADASVRWQSDHLGLGDDPLIVNDDGSAIVTDWSSGTPILMSLSATTGQVLAQVWDARDAARAQPLCREGSQLFVHEWWPDRGSHLVSVDSDAGREHWRLELGVLGASWNPVRKERTVGFQKH